MGGQEGAEMERGEESDGQGTRKGVARDVAWCQAVILFSLRSKLDNKVLVFHPVVYKEYSYHETYSETLTTSTGC